MAPYRSRISSTRLIVFSLVALLATGSAGCCRSRSNCTLGSVNFAPSSDARPVPSSASGSTLGSTVQNALRFLSWSDLHQSSWLQNRVLSVIATMSSEDREAATSTTNDALVSVATESSLQCWRRVEALSGAVTLGRLELSDASRIADSLLLRTGCDLDLQMRAARLLRAIPYNGPEIPRFLSLNVDAIANRWDAAIPPIYEAVDFVEAVRKCPSELTDAAVERLIASRHGEVCSIFIEMAAGRGGSNKSTEAALAFLSGTRSNDLFSRFRRLFELYAGLYPARLAELLTSSAVHGWSEMDVRRWVLADEIRSLDEDALAAAIGGRTLRWDTRTLRMELGPPSSPTTLESPQERK
jgi:hypothetical protein